MEGWRAIERILISACASFLTFLGREEVWGMNFECFHCIVSIDDELAYEFVSISENWDFTQEMGSNQNYLFSFPVHEIW